MKKILLIFGVLIVAFIAVWAAKLRTPLTPTDPYATGLSDEAPWWETNPNETPTPEDEWVLDPEIPSNYIPVLGGDELYMVVDEEGNIIKYRQRTLQEDGSWLWEDVDPNIPSNYEAVPGLENVYKVTEADGSVHYYRYTRNPDDTFYFTEVDENGNPLEDDTPDNGEIPANFVHVGNNIYAVYNEYGVLVGYKERVQNADGTYTWVDADPPASTQQTIPSGTGGIPGQTVVPNQGTGTGGGDIYIVTDDPEQTEQGYKEEETYTETKEDGDWVVVYETIVTREYDEHGNLVSTKKDGPNEISRFPKTEVNESFFD